MRTLMAAALIGATVLAASTTAQAATGFTTVASPNPGSNTLGTVAGTAAGQPLWAAGFGTGGTPQTASLIKTTTG